MLLSLPWVKFPYLFDDYDFLERAQRFRWSYLGPDPTLIFYRPVSREIYFGILNAFSPQSALLGHVVNAGFLAAAILLTSHIASRLAGPRAAVAAGFVLAFLAPMTVLVASVSCAQDLFAIVFTLLAVALAMRGRIGLSLASMALAMLSKETAVAAAPAVVATQLFRPPGSRRMVTLAAWLVLSIGLWAVIHPGIRLIVERGVSAEGTYIGIHNPSRWSSLVKSVVALANAPLRLPTPWPSDLNWVLAACAVPTLGAMIALGRWKPHEEVGPGQTAAWKVFLFCGLLSLPPLISVCFLVRIWSPYYVCFAGAGVAVLVGYFLSTRGNGVMAALLAAYLILGVWSRGVDSESVMNERSLLPAARALPEVEQNFKHLVPRMPGRSAVYVTTMARGRKSVYTHLHRFQALRVWYGDPTIVTLRPELYVIGSGPEFLFVVEPDLNVLQVDPTSLGVRSANGRVEHSHVRSALRSLAIGMSGMGRIEEAVQILLHIDPPGDGNTMVNRRIAAMLLLSRGEEEGAGALLKGLPDLPVARSIETVGILLTVPTRGVALEVPALKAFGLRPDDPDVLRALLGGMMALSYYDQAERIAIRLLTLRPGQKEAEDALDRIHRFRRVSRDMPTPPVEILGGRP